MRLFGIFNTIIVSAAVMAAFSSCADEGADCALDAAESVIWTRPDSALSEIESIDTLSLQTKARKARCSLLLTMALDRNNVDTARMSVLRPALRYYERHGTDDDKMKVSYYQAVIQMNAGDYQQAVGSLLKSKEYSLGSDNFLFRGLISSALSDVYAKNFNYSEKIKHARDACGFFRHAKDTLRYWNTLGWLAGYYADSGDWAKSDSLYAEFLSIPCQDSLSMARHLLNMAKVRMRRPDVDPRDGVEIFRKAVDEYKGRPSLTDYCVYAYALEMSGEPEVADGIFSQVESLGLDAKHIDVWRYRVLKHRGGLKDALNMLERLIGAQDSVIISTLNQSVVQAQADYFQAKSELAEKSRGLQMLAKWIIVLLAVIVFLGLSAAYLFSKRKWLRRMGEMSAINDIVCRSLAEEQDVSSAKDVALSNLRRKYVRTFKRQYSQLNDLCAEYWEAVGSGREKDRIYLKVKRIVSVIDGCNQQKLERMIDENLNGIMRKLRSDLPDATDNDFRFIALNILGFDAKTIARVMGYAVQSVYTKRVRLRSWISGLDSENKDFYLDFIG